MDKQTSDERLLKLIEGSGAAQKGKQVIAQGLKRAPNILASGKFNFLWLESKIKDLKVSLLYLNKGLIGLAVLLTLIFIYTIFTAPVAPKSNADLFSQAGASTMIKSISTGQAQGLMRKNISIQNIKRDFFVPFSYKTSGALQEAGTELAQELKALKLVGIIWSGNPEVMIEDTKDSRTYTLKKGESIDSQFKIKEITRNSAILEVDMESGTQEYELR